MKWIMNPNKYGRPRGYERRAQYAREGYYSRPYNIPEFLKKNQETKIMVMSLLNISFEYEYKINLIDFYKGLVDEEIINSDFEISKLKTWILLGGFQVDKEGAISKSLQKEKNLES